MGLIPGSRRSPGEGNGNPLQYLPEESHGERSLVGYSPWGHEESDTTESHTHTYTRVTVTARTSHILALKYINITVIDCFGKNFALCHL